jgi:phytoene dehydrogenase-like protein
MKYDTIIVGGGIAGLTAAAYLARAGQSVALFEQQSKTGGLVQTFQRDGVYFDGGLRSIENSGIVFPMLEQLGIDIEWVESKISIAIGNDVLVLKDKQSVEAYEKFLGKHFPDSKADIQRIIGEIRKIMGYMDVLYAVDNPAFKDLKKDRQYVFKVLLPWIFKFLFTVKKINNLFEPFEDYLRRFSDNQALLDIIGQHFFEKTPASFALSYFSLYLDYHYPKGGTATLVERLTEFIKQHGGQIKTSTAIESYNPEKQYVVDQNGQRTSYDHMIWAADQKQLYNRVSLETMTDKRLIRNIQEKKEMLHPLKGGDSVFTVYLTAEEDIRYFEEIMTGHNFYTPSKKGLSTLSKAPVKKLLEQVADPKDEGLKAQLIEYLEAYCDLNTFEIAIPALRDPDLAPKGKTGLIVSFLYDYRMAKKIDEFGWTSEIKTLLEQRFIKILDEGIFPGIKNKIIHCFSSSPVTIEKMTSSTEGGITGWAFTNPIMPAVNKNLQISKSVDTILPGVFQSGQWVFSPAGLPISILTGKLASDKVLKRQKR